MKRQIVATAAVLLLQAEGFALTNATWVGGFNNNDLLTAANWTPATVPTGIATFQNGVTTPTLSSLMHVSEFHFPFTGPNESFNFTISGSNAELDFINIGAAGVIVDNNLQQTFNVTNQGLLGFFLSSTAGGGSSTASTIYNISNFAEIEFANSSSFGNVVLNLDNNGFGFYNSTSTSASPAVINLTNNSQFEFFLGTYGSIRINSIASDATSTLFIEFTQLFIGGDNRNTTLAGTIQFDGVFPNSNATLNKIGTGTLTLPATSVIQFGGIVNLLQGSIVYSGTGSDLDINTSAGTLLTGTGSVTGAYDTGITIGGTISPGETLGQIGTLTFNTAPYVQASGSTYIAELNGAGNSDLIDIVGSTATIQGNTTLAIQSLDGGFLFNHPYLLMHADGGISGTFSNVEFSSLFVVPHVSYVDGPTNLIVEFTTNFFRFANKKNKKIAATLDALSNDSPTPDEVTLLNALAGLSNAKALNLAFTKLSGLPYTYMSQLAEYTDFRFNRRLFNAVRDWAGTCCRLPCFNTWVQTEYDHADVYGRDNLCKVHTNSVDGSLGVQGAVSRNFLVGAAGNYSFDRNRFTFNRSSHPLETGQGAIYALYRHRLLYLFSDLILGQTWSNHFRRNIDFGTYEEQAQSSIRVFHGKYYAEAGFLIGFQRNFIPFVGGDAGWYKRDKIEELDAAAANRIVAAKAGSYGDVYAGTHFRFPVRCFSFSGDLYYQHRFGSFDNRVDAGFVSFGGLSGVQSLPFGRNGVVGTLNFSATPKKGAEISVELNGQKWERFSSYGATLNLALSF